MKEFESINDILDFAIRAEEEARIFYLNLAETVETPSIKEIFRDFALEEAGHREKLLRVQEGDSQLLSAAEVPDLKIGDYLVDAEPAVNMTTQSALILAMKKEKAAFKLYTDLAKRMKDSSYRTLFQMLAQEEAKHKLRFEMEYDEIFNQEN